MTDSPKVPLENDPCHGESGVLLSDRIKYYANTHRMIQPFCKDSLEPAGYKMRVGKTYYHGREKKELCEGEFLEIAPHDVVLIETTERICLPRFMIARWNIKVKLAYKGLLWVGAAQVDPGYVGHLACPIYNLSTKTVRLRRNQELALIDFVKTTPYTKDSCESFPSSPARGIGDVVIDGLGIESALSEYQERLDEVEKIADGVKSQATYFTTLVITLLGVLFAVLVLVGGDSNASVQAISGWGTWVRIVAVVLSLALSATALTLVLGFGRKRKSVWSFLSGGIIFIPVVVVISFLLGLFFR